LNIWNRIYISGRRNNTLCFSASWRCTNCQWNLYIDRHAQTRFYIRAVSETPRTRLDVAMQSYIYLVEIFEQIFLIILNLYTFLRVYTTCVLPC